jgi:hypothetical protein
MIVRESASIGQLRIADRAGDQYLSPSERPFPPLSESELIDKGVIHNLEPVWGKLDWPGWKAPPSIPSLENEVYDVRREMRRVIWPRRSPWKLNYRARSAGTLTPPTKDNLGFFHDGWSPSWPKVVSFIMLAASSVLISTASVRAMKKEEKLFWKIVLGVSAFSPTIPLIAWIFSSIKKNEESRTAPVEKQAPVAREIV